MKIKKIFRNRIVLMVISLLVAIGLWIYVANVENVETSKTLKVSVEYTGDDTLEARNLMVSDEDMVTTVSIKFTATRSELSELTADEISVTVDLSSITSSGNQAVTYEIKYPDDVDAEDYDTSDNDDYIMVNVLNVITDEVVIEGELEGSIAEGYTGKDFTFEPETITVTGPEEVINEIDKALVTVTREDPLDASISGTETIVLYDSDGNVLDLSENNITLSMPTVEYTYTVLMVKELTLTVNLVAGGGLTSSNTTYVVDPLTITVEGEPEVLEDKNTLELGTIDLAEVVDGEKITFTIILDDGIQSASGETEATVTLTTAGVETKIIYVTDIVVENVPDGYTAELITNILTITIRGNEDDVDQITEEDITATVDLIDKEITATGSQNMEVTITIDGYDDVDVLDTYSVVVDIQEEETEE